MKNISIEFSKHNIVIFTSIVIFLYGIFYLLPIIDKIEKLQNQRYSSSIKNIVVNSKTTMGKTADSFIVKQHVENNIKIAYNIKNACDSTKVSIQKLTFGNSVDLLSSSDNKSLPIQLVMSGNLNNIVDFVNIIESQRLIFEIVSFEINTIHNGDTKFASAQMNIRYIYSGGI